MKHLILGGARSGKSGFAERCAADSGRDVTYVSTAEAGDAEMAERIAHHRARRPAHWDSVEAPLHLGEALAGLNGGGRVVVVDCLTVWLSNLIGFEEPDQGRYRRERAALLDAVDGFGGDLLLVSNEVGLGLVPANAMARRFRDEAGRLNQELAVCCDRVTFVAAGLPLTMKG